MTIKFSLTKRQSRLLAKHMKMVNAAFFVGQRGTFVAQIQQDHWTDDLPYVTAHFYPRTLAQPIIEAVARARPPNCYEGIPMTAFQPRSAHTSRPLQEKT